MVFLIYFQDSEVVQLDHSNADQVTQSLTKPLPLIVRMSFLNSNLPHKHPFLDDYLVFVE